MDTRTVNKLPDNQRPLSISHYIIEMVVDDLGVDPLELPPLYETIDPDALDARFASSTTSCPGFGQVTFDYIGYEITVSYDGEVVITLDKQSSP